MDIIQILMIIEIVISSVLILIIVLQPSDADAGTLFGGGFGDDVKRTRRGAELAMHNATKVLVVFWVAIALAIMFLGG